MKQSRLLGALPATLCLLNLFAAPAQAVTVGQIDDFQDLTAQGWTGGTKNPNPPVNVANGGLLGGGDAYLKLTSNGGSGAGSRLVGFNQTEWAGDYLSAGVNALTMDLNNLGATDLFIRLAINGSGGEFSTTAGVPLAAANGWDNFLFDLTPGAWTSVGGADINATLGNVSQLRILHAPSPIFRGGLNIDAMLGVDNISAVPVPAAVWLFGSGLLGLIAISRRTRAI